MVIQCDVARRIVKVNCGNNQVSDPSGLGKEGEDGDIILVVVAVMRLMVDYDAG